MIFPPDHLYSLELTKDNKKGEKQPQHRQGESIPEGLQSVAGLASGDKINKTD